MDTPKLKLVVYSEELTIYRLPPSAKIPEDVLKLKWYTISKNLDELSIMIPSKAAISWRETVGLDEDTPAIKQEDGWRCFKIDSTLDFGLIGVLASVINPLKEAGIPVFVISTFDTDYILVKQNFLADAKKVIVEKGGHSVSEIDTSFH